MSIYKYAVMPELPEVETVVRNLSEVLDPSAKLVGFKLWRKDIRYPIPEKMLKTIIQAKSREAHLRVERRAKYILINLAEYVIISHLGMTGMWSVYKGDLNLYEVRKHDHLALEFATFKSKAKNLKKQSLWLIYNDPRRFGFVHVVKKTDVKKYFENYGYEPLQMTKRDVESLFNKAKHLKTPIKTFVMNQKYIVGVGNIYACEALFKAQISPFRAVNKLNLDELNALINQIKKNLTLAIRLGGSSIRDYKNVKNEKGSFQNAHLVYAKEKQLCKTCKEPIQKKVQAGRSTFFCSTCQT
ncbi:MAG: bifunctional DNA-formamidopyrimidine glycosylase/DNA-(apurinic or apyrimidinic site) lyase [Pseudobdellovibrio sp.]